MYVSPKHWGENPVHQPLVSGASILEAKGHDLITVVGELNHKDNLVLVSQVHMDLVVPRERVQEAQQSTTRGTFHQGIYTWKRVRILGKA